mgnify:CR=1 FL=1
MQGTKGVTIVCLLLLAVPLLLVGCEKGESDSAKIEAPAQKIFMWDSSSSIQHWPRCTNSTGCHDGNITARHNEGANCLFCDGHVKWEKEATMRRSTNNYSPTATPAW